MISHPAQCFHAVTRNRDREHLALHIAEADGFAPSTSSAFRAKCLAQAWRVWNSGVACVAVASLIFSVSALFVKLTGNRVPVFEIVAVRSGLSWLISMVLASLNDVKPVYGQRRHYPILAARGLIGATAMTLSYEALKRLPLADAMTIFFTNPAMTVIAVWLVFGEPITWSSVVGCAASFAGVVLVAQPPFIFGGRAAVPWGHERMMVGMGLAAAMTSAGAFTAIRSIKKSEPSLVVALWFHTFALVSSTIPLAFGFPQHAVWPSPFDAGCMVGVALTSFFGQILINRGFQSETAAKVSAVNYTQEEWG
ncbi:hypothetical protein WJX72_012035 [[Myrmecia] bisecta]|uniref:EamA domain-containing protein n=1 Tax=[Myrmecia] bisecta TaxID=41462 RepID=A0AAW1QT80_9CHLO